MVKFVSIYSPIRIYESCGNVLLLEYQDYQDYSSVFLWSHNYPKLYKLKHNLRQTFPYHFHYFRYMNTSADACT